MAVKPKISSSKKRVEEIESELEKFKIRVQVFDELIKISSTHVNDIEGRLGELRGGLTEREKEIRKLGVKVERASDLVSQTKPEQLMRKYEEHNTKLEVLQAKIGVYHKISQKIMGELKEIRTDMSLFKGVKQLLDLVSEVREDLTMMKKLKVMVERSAERSEKIYIEMERKHKDFLKYKEMNNQLREQVRELVKIIKK